MDPTTPPKNIIEQLNSFCQADIKSQWTAKRLKASRDVCGFSYVENDAGDWVMMPTLCSNCQYTLNHQLASTQSNKKINTTTETKFAYIYPSPLPSQLTTSNDTQSYKQSGQQDDAVSTDYLLYPKHNTRSNYMNNNSNSDGLEFYRPSLASSINCCQIL